jgi:hypothetical protein
MVSYRRAGRREFLPFRQQTATNSTVPAGEEQDQEAVLVISQERREEVAPHFMRYSSTYGHERLQHHLLVADFFAAASSWRNAAMVAAEGSLRLLFLGRRLVLLV